MTQELLSREISFQITVTPGQVLRFEELSTLTGKIIQVIRHWPAGCISLVDIAMGKENDIWILPQSGYVALDDATPVSNLNEPIDIGDKIWVVVRDRDAVTPFHNISVTVLIEGTP